MDTTQSLNSLNLNIESNKNNYLISFGDNNLLRLLFAPADVQNVTCTVLAKYWQNFECCNKVQGLIEFKIPDFIWCSYGVNDSKVKYFICALFQQYYEIGWQLKIVSDFQRYANNTNVMIFEKCAPLNTCVVCLSLNDTDKIRLLGPENLVPILREAIINSWSYGIQQENFCDDKSYEFKLKGNIWSEDQESHYSPSGLMTQLLSTLYNNGWIFIGAVKACKTKSCMNALYFRSSQESIFDENVIKGDENTNKIIFSISLICNDKIRFIDVPSELLNTIKNEMPYMWRHGIQKEKFINTSYYEFKLKGKPWSSSGEEAVDSRHFMNLLFNLTRRQGWQIYAVCNLTNDPSSKSTFFFQYNCKKLEIYKNFCLSLNHSDKIRIIDGDENIINLIRNSIGQAWIYGIKNEIIYNNSYQYQLFGAPFDTFGIEQIHTCTMMLNIMNNMKKLGFNLIISADLSSKHVSCSNNQTGACDLHSWFFELN